MDTPSRYREYWLGILTLPLLVLLQACATTTMTPYVGNPWSTPTRPGMAWSTEEYKEIRANLQPCVDHARNTIPDVLRRFKEDLLPETSLYVSVFNDPDHGGNFFVQVTAVEGSRINGRLHSANAQVNGQRYRKGDEYSLEMADIADWLISYPDRPEEGNWGGRYLLLRQEGLVSSLCDPQDRELQHFRLFLDSYSFVPPIEAGWELLFANPYSLAPQMVEATLKRIGKGPNELNMIFTVRYKIESPSKTDEEFMALARKIAQERNIGEGNDDRYTSMEHTVTPYAGKDARCAVSHQVVDDRTALLNASGERRPMIREVMSLVCVHPREWNQLVILVCTHRYEPGHKDPTFVDQANSIFDTLAFRVRR